MRGWPPIEEPELLERLALDDAAFGAFLRRLSGAWGRRSCDEATLRWALGYPWPRPPSSFVLLGEDVTLLGDLAADERRALVEAFTRERHPLLSYGANASPSGLSRKFAHFEDEADRTALVLAGRLEDFDVGPAATLSPAGYMAATLFASPGTRVRASVVWATAAQATQLTWSEVPYRLVRLDDAQFHMDDGELDVEVDGVFAFVHRLGLFRLGDRPVALAAVEAEGRGTPAMTQEALLDHVAPWLLGDGARAADLVRALYEDTAAVQARAAEIFGRDALHLERGWTPFPAPAPPG